MQKHKAALEEFRKLSGVFGRAIRSGDVEAAGKAYEAMNELNAGRDSMLHQMGLQLAIARKNWDRAAELVATVPKGPHTMLAYRSAAEGLVSKPDAPESLVREVLEKWSPILETRAGPEGQKMACELQVEAW